jgi:hypothetical protein
MPGGLEPSPEIWFAAADMAYTTNSSYDAARRDYAGIPGIGGADVRSSSYL